MESLEAHHRSGDPLDEAVVLFQYVVGHCQLAEAPEGV
jgi:hypothetical protein